MSEKFVSTPRTPRDVYLHCPSCGEIACFSVNLAGMEDGTAFTCKNCNTEFGFDEMRTVVNCWQKVLDRVAALMSGLAVDLEGIDEAGANKVEE